LGKAFFVQTASEIWPTLEHFYQAQKSDYPDYRAAILHDFAKFSEHADLRALLLAAGNAELIEGSPFEPFWGIGANGAGLNSARRVLMEVRERPQFGAS
jgi:predicted NAD-dependent protein-ADP-ribosyltransferase YbiA (DUF1768 family)